MNFIITSKCNKNCNFCFATKGDKKMFLDDYEILADMADGIKILGGEPTLHPQFSEFINLKNKKDITLISNLIFGKDVLESIKNSNVRWILANCSYLDEKNIEIFTYNYVMLSQHLMITCGMTIEEDVSTEYYIEYLKKLRKYFKISSFRISLNFPGSESKKNEKMYVNNKAMGAKIIEVVKVADELNDLQELIVDCFMYPCMFEDIEFYKKYLSTRNCSNKERGFPMDVLPDMTCLYCYPTSDKIKIDLKTKNLNTYNSMNLERDLQKIYLDLNRNKKLPDECVNCEYFDYCGGPCLGLYN